MAKTRIKQMSYRNSYASYNSTSVATDYSGYEDKPYQKNRTRVKRVIKKRRKPIFVMSAQAKNLSFSIYFMVIIGFLLLLAVTVAGSNVTIQRRYNTQFVNDLRNIEIQNNQLQNQIDQARNTEKIMYIARNRLNMSEPLPHQVRSISLIPSVHVEPVFTMPVHQTLTTRENIQSFFYNMLYFFTDQ